MAYFATKTVTLDTRGGDRMKLTAGQRVPEGPQSKDCLPDNIAGAARMGCLRYEPDDSPAVDEEKLRQDARKKQVEEIKSKPWAKSPLKDLPVSSPVNTALKNAKMDTVGDVASYGAMHDGDYTGIKGIGSSNADEIKRALDTFIGLNS